MGIRSTCSGLALASLIGCAGPPTLAPIARGEAVAITVVRSPQSDAPVRVRNEALGKDAATGAGSGALVGGLWGLGCGPFAVLCVPLGAAAGLVTGITAGAVVGVSGALADDKVEQVRDRLARQQQSRPLAAELQRAIDARAQRHWQLDASPMATAVTVELQAIELTSTRDERVRATVRVTVTARPATRVYEYLGPYGSLAVWLDEGNDFIETTLAGAGQQLAAQIVADLAPK